MFFVPFAELHFPRIVVGLWRIHRRNLALSYLNLQAQCAEYFPILRKLQVSPPSRRTNEGKPARSNRAELRACQPCNVAFSLLISFHCCYLCVCVCTRHQCGSYVYHARKLQRTFAACTGAGPYWRSCEGEDCSLHLTSSFVETSISQGSNFLLQCNLYY